MTITTDKRHWHLSKAVQLPVIVLLCGNVLGSVWWAAKLDAKTTDMITASSVNDKLINRDIAISHNTSNINRVYNSISKLDSKIDKVLAKVK